MRKVLGVVAVVSLVALLAVAGPARAGKAPAAQMNQANVPPVLQYLKNATDVSIEGELASVVLKGPLAILKVDTSEGTREVLFHPLRAWGSIELTTGEHVKVEGKLVQLGERELVVPIKMTLNDKVLDFSEFISKIARFRNRVFQGYPSPQPGWRGPGYRYWDRNWGYPGFYGPGPRGFRGHPSVGAPGYGGWCW